VAELAIEIAGVCTEILTRDPELAEVIRERYKGFRSAGTSDWRIEMKVEAISGPSVAGKVTVRRDGGPATFTVQRGDFAGTLDLRHRTGTATLGVGDDVPLDSFLRIVYSLALLDVRGLVLHAASLVRRGRAHLFCGPSGSGKTTVARLSPDAILLSDELSMVRTFDTRARCYGTPFSGELARAGEDRAAPLGGIYFLHHGNRHTLDAVEPRQALQRLLPNVLFFAREPELTARVLDIAAGLVEAVPCFDLSFRLDPGFWEVIEHA
jgi:hypothetical protein